MNEQKITIQALINESSRVKNFLDEKMRLLTPSSKMEYSDILSKEDVYVIAMILAMDDKAYKINILLMNLVKVSSHDTELLGYALFQEHFAIVGALEKRLSVSPYLVSEKETPNASLGWTTLNHLYSLGKLSKEETENVIQDSVSVALMSGNPKVINYIGARFKINSDSFLKAAEFGKIATMKHIYSPDLRPEKQAAALAVSLRNNFHDGVNFLLEKLNNFSTFICKDKECHLDLVLASLEYQDTRNNSKSFSTLLKCTNLNEEDVKVVRKEAEANELDNVLDILSAFTSTSVPTTLTSVKENPLEKSEGKSELI